MQYLETSYHTVRQKKVFVIDPRPREDVVNKVMCIRKKPVSLLIVYRMEVWLSYIQAHLHIDRTDTILLY